MSEMTITAPSSAERNERGQFKLGHSGYGGRPKGARSRLGEQFLLDLRGAWAKHGVQALERAAVEDPVAFAKIVSALLPEQIEIGGLADFSECGSVDEIVAMLVDESEDAAELLADLDKLREQIAARIAERAR